MAGVRIIQRDRVQFSPSVDVSSRAGVADGRAGGGAPRAAVDAVEHVDAAQRACERAASPARAAAADLAPRRMNPRPTMTLL